MPFAANRVVIGLSVVAFILGSCAANSYHRIVGTVGEIQTKPNVWVVQVFDNDGQTHRIRIPLRVAGQTGYDIREIEQKLHSGTRVDVVTGPKQVVRRLVLTKNKEVILLQSPNGTALKTQSNVTP
ncbi:MAG: hypothetical protein K9N11_07985 [Lentisphaeria bacterium]|nr:hypothetical protein [Candidatus Neomarinimicrobiota bacterium]MCF7842775.1 hypothetical protein [Lentisphaeria bacterium]